MNRVWFISGCSSGFGRLLAERVLAMGERVVVTARSSQALYDLGREDESRILRLPLDVSNATQVREVVAAAAGHFGQIDVLINNAGYGYFGTQEEGDLEDVKKMFDTNVFGLISLTQSVVPLMRQRRSGTIVNVSSIGGRITTPRGGFYQATKWAVEALSESLYLEVSGFGLRVIIIEPGSYDTDFGPRSARLANAETDPSSAYAELRELWKQNVSTNVFARGQKPVEVVETIIDAVNSNLQFVRLPVGIDATTVIARRLEMGSEKFVEWMRNVVYKR